MKNNNAKKMFINEKGQHSQLNILKAQLKSKLMQIGIVFNEAPRQIQAYKNTLISRDRAHKKMEALPNMQSQKTKALLNDQFQDKLQPRYPDIFSYRANRGAKINQTQILQTKSNVYGSSQKFQPFSPQSFRECFRHKIIKEARNKLQSQSAIISRQFNKETLILKSIQEHSIVVKKIKDNKAKNVINNELNNFKRQIKEVNHRLRSKTEQNEAKIDKSKRLKNTFYRDITPWHQNKAFDRQQQFF